MNRRCGPTVLPQYRGMSDWEILSERERVESECFAGMWADAWPKGGRLVPVAVRIERRRP